MLSYPLHRLQHNRSTEAKGSEVFLFYNQCQRGDPRRDMPTPPIKIKQHFHGVLNACSEKAMQSYPPWSHVHPQASAPRIAQHGTRRNSANWLSMNASSFGLNPGNPAMCPLFDRMTRNSPEGINGNSASLSSTRK